MCSSMAEVGDYGPFMTYGLQLPEFPTKHGLMYLVLCNLPASASIDSACMACLVWEGFFFPFSNY